MRKILHICLPGALLLGMLLLGALSVSGQHYVGVKGGYGAAMGRFDTAYGSARKQPLLNRYTAGVVWKYFSPQQVTGGFSAELEYQQRGYTVFSTISDNATIGAPVIVNDSTRYRTHTRTVNSITLPLVWHPHLYMVNRSVRLFASLGVTVSYNTGLGDRLSVSDYEFDLNGNRTVKTVTTPYKMQTARDVRWNYGAVMGGGVGVLVWRMEIFAEARYYWGMSDILRYKNRYQFNDEQPLRTELSNIFITPGVSFRLGKGGILAPPLRRPRAATSGNDFRNIKLDF
ncbi:MAG: PorT family protein [Alistipes sp.]|jgi:hypothetical protein|nr:PorT family protein [Alistipes sp.]